MNAPAKIRMNVPEFLEWAERQPKGRYELVDGEVFEMSPERNRHLIVKGEVFRALGDAIARAEVDCAAYTDGASVKISESALREPDVVVQCGQNVDLDALTIDAPIIVVEVISPTSVKGDSTIKLVEYFSVASIQHYLVIDPVKKIVIHHQRVQTGGIHTRIIQTDGELDLTPPGMTVPITQFFGRI